MTIDSLTMQSSFSGVRLESYMFTTESFKAVRDHLKPDGLLLAALGPGRQEGSDQARSAG